MCVEYHFYRRSWQRTFCKARVEKCWIILILFLAIGGIGFVYIPRHKSNNGDGTIIAQKQGKLSECNASHLTKPWFAF
jgi:hypothetical protein